MVLIANLITFCNEQNGVRFCTKCVRFRTLRTGDLTIFSMILDTHSCPFRLSSGNRLHSNFIFLNFALSMEKQGKIFIVDDNEDVLFALNYMLEPYVEKVKVTTQPTRIEHFMATFQPDVILLDMNFSKDVISGQEGYYWLDKILTIDPKAVVIFITAYTDTEKVVRAIKAGATDFVSKPWDKEKLLAIISSGVKLKRSRMEEKKPKEVAEVLNETGGKLPTIIGRSPAMQEVFTMIQKLSGAEANVLILGENGTGKDLVARAIHHFSPRQGKPFASIDMGSIPESIFESELFGYEKGAFTGARDSKAGRMEVASGGTLFLDEIGNLSYEMQSKLLTAIEKHEISRLGSTRKTAIDVRLVCATNANIRKLVEEGKFRQDLYFRINTIEIEMPPLRERGEDILLLAEHFMQHYAKKCKKTINGLSREAKQKLMRYDWPGNVRELQHLMEKAVILADDKLLMPDDFTFPSKPEKQAAVLDSLNLGEVEKYAIEQALKMANGNLSYAAEILGITRYALYRKIEKFGL